MQDGIGGQKGWRFHTRSPGEEEPGAFYTWRNTGAFNQIKKIENIDVLKNLRFLSLSWNRVEKIQNLRCLTNLQFLDISHNLIKRLDACELPQSLLILDLTGNPCTKAKDYRPQILEALPLLQQLDGETVRDSANSNSLSDVEDEQDGSSSDDSDESLPFDVLEGLSSVSQEMIQRSYQRRDRALREHEERLSELSDTPNKQLLITAQNATANIVSQECSSMSLKQASTCATKPQNAMISEKKHQKSALVKKQLKDQQNNGTAMPPSKLIARNQESVSTRKPGNGRLSEGLNRTSCKKLLPSAPQSKPDTVPSVKTPSALNTPQKERQAISAPSTRKMNAVPTKNTLPAPEKVSSRHSPSTVSSRSQNERQATSAPVKKILQSPEKLAMTRLKVNSGAQGTRKKSP
ncbi:leucine-rich repeat-containing protein 46 isoform X2 [Bufo bufo]|uniref:leucine-rich repeat-containing protein 46 isoform X2 n=1 Tax=Bufo bufo TaxID=8384 RepID=UPI001ABDDE7A|nr:leucine-rich repeat-containing protein 46 isoform X2 [Bufo bufo]